MCSVGVVLDGVKKMVFEVVFGHKVGDTFIIATKNLVEVAKDYALFLLCVDGVDKIRKVIDEMMPGIAIAGRVTLAEDGELLKMCSVS